MVFLRPTFISFFVGVILTSAIFIFIRPLGIKKPTPESSPGPDGITLSERERCEKELGLYLVPLLSPPALHPSTPTPILTNYEGEAYVKWVSVPKAKNYFIQVSDSEGKELRTYRTPYIAIYLKSLPRPERGQSEKYQIRIASVNANDLIGKFSSPHTLIIKKPLDLTAPKIQEIRVED